MTGFDRTLQGAGLILSLLLHGIFFINVGSVAGNAEQVPQERKVTKLSFRSEVAPQHSPQAQQEKPKPKEDNRKARKVKQPEPEKNTPTPQAAPTAEAKVAGSVDDQAVVERARQKYLRELMAHIEGYKRYPNAARRRRLEGDVRVAFSLQSGGMVTGLNTGGAHNLLNTAASEAVSAAQPLPEPPKTLRLPWQVTFTMRFTIH